MIIMWLCVNDSQPGIARVSECLHVCPGTHLPYQTETRGPNLSSVSLLQRRQAPPLGALALDLQERRMHVRYQEPLSRGVTPWL